jgi:hypothetical protein
MSINPTAKLLSKGPYSWEFIAERPEGMRYRIRDSRDDAIGSAATEAEADALVRRLNGGQS